MFYIDERVLKGRGIIWNEKHVKHPLAFDYYVI